MSGTGADKLVSLVSAETEKVQKLVGARVDELCLMMKDQKQHSDAQHAEVMAELQRQKKQLEEVAYDLGLAIQQVHTALLAGQQIAPAKKAAPRAKAEPTEAGDAAPTGDTPATPAAPATKRNKRQIWEAKYKEDPEFRKEYLTPEIEAEMAKVPAITGAKDEAKRIMEQRKFVYQYHSAHPETGGMAKIDALAALVNGTAK